MNKENKKIYEYKYVNGRSLTGELSWVRLINQMSQQGWRFIQFTSSLRMKSPGPYGYYIFERELNSFILNDSGKSGTP